MSVLLAILIPSLYERKKFYNRLVNELNKQIGDRKDIAICSSIDNREKTTGKKRNELLRHAAEMGAKYVVSIDDDDVIAGTYIADIVDALQMGPDCVTFNGIYTKDGRWPQQFKLSINYEYETKDNIHYRPPNHIVPIRTSIASQFKFPDISYGEDYDWCMQIKNSGLIKTEVRIEKDLYFYRYNSRK